MAYNFGVDSEKAKKIITRFRKLPKNHSFFLFGPRGCGKSTLILDQFKKNSYLINLLDQKVEREYSRDPNRLVQVVEGLDEKVKFVVIDEIQKIPKLLDLVHLLIESTNKIFVLTGSSARKLKRGGANLLAGRAFKYNLHPFSYFEIEDICDLNFALEWGTLPKIYEEKNDYDFKFDFLESYSHTYLKEEIWEEQFIKNLDPFRQFLEVAAQMNGKIVNFSKVAKDVGVDDKTVKNYYSILEDTLIGFFLPCFKHSFRKRLSSKPKFYFFDTGVSRALSRTLSVPLQESTSAYGNAFEHFLILECIKLAEYFKREYRFSYLKTKDDAEVDLIVERPGQATLFVEIKSSEQVDKTGLTNLMKLSQDFDGDCEAICLSRETSVRKVEDVLILPWQEGLKKYFM